MSDPIVWESLPKSQTDPTVIVDAVAAQITDHDNDPDAHLGTDQSLQSHKASIIIDHLAESVVNDKLKATARRYVAIVDPNSSSDYPDLASALAAAIAAGGGEIFVTRGTFDLPAEANIYPTISITGSGVGQTILKNTLFTDFAFFFLLAPIGPTIPYSNFTVTHGSTTFSMTLGTLPPGVHVVGSGVQFYDGTTHQITRITAYLGSNTWQLATAPGGSGTYNGQLTIPFVTATNGSQALVLAGDIEISDGWFVVGSLITLGAYGDFARIVGFDQPNIIYIDTPFTHTTGYYLASCAFDSVGEPHFSNLTFDTLGTGVLFDDTNFVSPIPNGVFFDTCAFLGGGGYLTLGFSPTIATSCTFDCYADAGLDLQGDAELADCVFTAQAAASVAVGSGNSFRATNCNFLSNGHNAHVWIQFDGGDFFLDHCVMQSCGSMALDNDASGPLLYKSGVVNSWISAYSTNIITLNFIDGIVSGNTFNSTTGHLVLGTSSSKTIAIGNKTDHGFTNLGTGNVLGNNI